MNASHFSKDCLEFIDVLNKHDVRWVIVGGEAVIYHGHVRLTGDVDFYFERTSENCRNLYQALEEFWNDDIPGGLSKRDLEAKGYFIQFGVPPNRLDLMNQIDGVLFQEVWDNKVVEKIEYRGVTVPVFFIGLEELIKNKFSSSRPKDQEDLIYLKSKLK